MPVCSHRITDWVQMNIVRRQKEIEALNIWTEKEDVAWKKLLRYSDKKMYSFLPVLQGCRSGVKPAWLNLCFSLSSLRAAAGFLLTRGNDGLIFGRDLEGTGNSMAVL